MPEAQPLALLRRNIDRKPEVIRRVLTDATLRKKVLGGIPNDEKKAVKAFALHNAESALKTKPKVRLNLCQSKHSSSRLYFLYCVSCIDLEATLLLVVSTPGQRCPTRLRRSVVDNLQIMARPFLHIQQVLVSVAPATAPILGAKHVC